MELEKAMSDPAIWDDQRRAKGIGEEIAGIQAEKNLFESLSKQLGDLDAYAELLKQDASLEAEAQRELKNFEEALQAIELKTLLSEPYDANSAILTIHPGAGGTESQDWAEMLLRMYSRWAARAGFTVELADLLPGDEAGIKSATLFVKGMNAFGMLKGETGVHRLVRISPFDANKRRHTSFASVELLPEIPDDVSVEVREDDVRIDTFRASGAGGQHVNKTDSAVRLTHLPTGIVVACQNERSQHQNKAMAFRILKAKLFERELESRQKKMEELAGEKKEIGWGRQIRSYVFQPYMMVKDLRTRHQKGDVQAVMNGEIDDFIKAYLVFRKTGRPENIEQSAEESDGLSS